MKLIRWIQKQWRQALLRDGAWYKVRGPEGYLCFCHTNGSPYWGTVEQAEVMGKAAVLNETLPLRSCFEEVKEP